jgi:4-hydroxy-tetrahydrodipicolinate reductase
MEPIRIAVAGAAGRMGRCIVRCVFEDSECTLVGAIESPGHMSVGRDAGVGGDPVGVTITDLAASLCDAEAVIDFTTPAVSVDIAEKAAEAGLVHVIGTTGFTEEQEARVAAASQNAVIIKSGNMSLGANLLAALVSRAAKVLRDFDVQIVEMHHQQKKDAPSGTALMLGRAAADSRANHVSDAVDSGVGFASLRGGTVVGEHKVIFAGAHERLILEHVAEDRSIFARGAIAAAKWGRGRTRGLYSMSDVLDL